MAATTIVNLVLDKAQGFFFRHSRTEKWRYSFLAGLISECSDRISATGETLAKPPHLFFSVNAPKSDDTQRPLSLPLSRRQVLFTAVSSARVNSFGLQPTTGEHNNQNQIGCLNTGGYMVFGSIAGSEYYESRIVGAPTLF